MAKQRSFADKVAKSMEKQGDTCPTCGETIKPILVVTPTPSERTGALRFRQNFVGVCSCNNQEVMG